MFRALRLIAGWQIRPEVHDALLKASKDEILVRVAGSGFLFEYCNPLHKADKEVVLAAVKEDGLALEHADPLLQD